MLDIFSVAVVLIRAIALLIIASAVPAIPGLLAAIKHGYDQEAYYSFAADPYTGPLVIWWLSLMLLVALFLIFSKKLARFLTRGLDNTNIQIDEASLSALQRVTFSVLGAYLVVYAAPTLVKMAAIGFLNATRNTGEALYPRVSPPDIIEVAVRLALGLWLLLGSRQITTSMSKMWMKLRSSFGAE
jgi:hypothetical protein